MPKLTPKLVLLAGALAVAGVFTIPLVQAAEKSAAEKAEAKKKDAENLRKYDRNRNGKLDPDEEAQLKADRQKAKAEKKKKS